MIDFYAAPTANCQRVAITLAELGLAHRTIPIDRAAGEQRAPAFLAINSAAAVPAIMDHETGIALAQSGAILVHLAEKAGRLLPTGGAARALTLQWLMHALTDVNAAASLFFMASRDIIPGVAPETMGFYEARLARFLGDAEQALAMRACLAGEFSIADLALYPVVVGRWTDCAIPTRYPALRDWARRLGERPAISRILPLG